MNNKVDFKTWLNNKYSNSPGIKGSYVRAIDILSDMLNKDIFSISSITELNELYDDLLVNQKSIDGKYFYKKAEGYGKKGFYSAAIKKLILFHQENQIAKTTEIDTTKPNYAFMNDNFLENCKRTNLTFQDSLITRFTTSLLTKPFVILTGLSGSGKTKLAQSFAMWLCGSEHQYKIVPVGADWTNREPLLGFPNALEPGTYVKPDSGVLDLIIRATNDVTNPYFLILDEMNLSHVERYFADFLSTMESDEDILLHAGAENWGDVPAKIKLPKNLFIVGTVNIDETTYMFSPKVLDRASVIEFRVTEKEMDRYLSQSGKVDLKAIKGQGAAMEQSFVELAKNRDLVYSSQQNMNDTLVSFFRELKKAGAEFGYRTASEIRRFAAVAEALETEWTTDEILDVVIMQKLLPKLHGSRKKLVPVLETLIKLCIIDGAKTDDFYQYKEDQDNDKVIYQTALEKLQRMYRGLLDNGFSSYAEA